MTDFLKKGFKLGPVEVRPLEHVLLVNGNVVHVEPKSMEVLVALAGAGQETIGRESLVEQVWPRGYVSDDALNRCISNLRNALDDTPRSGAFIVTVPRVGYRLAQPVVPLEAAESDDAVVVLPFQNLSGNSDDYVADGLTELLIARLSVALDQPVISRTTAMSFRNSDRDLKTISRRLGVRWVVEGSVMQLGDKVQIVVQLIDARTDTHKWAETWTRPAGDLMTVLNEVTRQVANRISRKVTGGMPGSQSRQNLPVDLLRQYLHGVQLNSRRSHESLVQAIACFECVLEAVPEHAPTLSAMAMSNVLLAHYGAVPAAQGFREARRLATQALAQDPDLADAKVHLAAIAFHHDWDFHEAQRLLKEGLEANPGLEMGLVLSANFNVVMRRFEEAQAWMDRALQIDPLNIGILMNAGDHLVLQRCYGEAVQVLKAALDISAGFRPGCLRLALAHAMNGSSEEAMSALARAKDLGGEDATWFEYLAIVRGQAGDRPGAVEAAGRMEKLESEGAPVLPWSLARGWASADRPDRAIEYLERAFDSRSTSMPFLGVTPVFDSLVDRPEVRALMVRIGLPSV